MVVMGLDYGERRLGVAVCDELGIAAHALPAVERDGNELDRLARIIEERVVECIVVGLPIRMDGTEGRQAQKVRRFAAKLRKRLPELEVELVDERLSSAQAHSALSQMGAGSRRRREAVDGMAAQIILQRYLGRRRSEGP